MTLPSDFITRTRSLLGTEFDTLAAALQTEAPVSIRINRRKKVPDPRPEQTDGRVAWCESGYYLPARPAFTFDPLFHAGAYYVQEASSMFLEQAVRHYVTEPVRCLDLCAAPGGKSTHLLDLLPEGSLLVSNEVIRSRSQVLAENVAKWGNPDCIVTNNDPAELGQLTHWFDLLVTDVPCSGEGMFRKDPASRDEWSAANVEHCAARQRRILHDVWDALRPGGLLVYSTCTFNTEEDEENIRYIIEELGAEALPIPVPAEWDIAGALRHTHPVYRFFPHRTRGEGFFLALLRKADGERQEIFPKGKNKKGKGKTAVSLPPHVKTWLTVADPIINGSAGNPTRLLSRFAADAYPLLDEHLRILSAGVTLGEMKGKDFIPAPELALSTALRPDAFPSVELDWEEAIRFLKKEAFPLPDSTERGYVLIRYKGFPLGFAKNLGNRANNLYPSEWRIRSGYMPEERLHPSFF